MWVGRLKWNELVCWCEKSSGINVSLVDDIEKVVFAELNDDFGPMAFSGVDSDLMTEFLAEILSDVKTHTGWGGAFAAIKAGESFLENLWEVARGDADAVILDGETDASRILAGGEFDFGVFGATVFDAVIDDLVDDKFEPFGVGFDGLVEVLGDDFNVVF